MVCQSMIAMLTSPLACPRQGSSWREHGDDGPKDDSPSTGSGSRPIRPRRQSPRNRRKLFANKTLDQTDDTGQSMGVTGYGDRYYDPLAGRWPSRDPIEERGGVNLYEFVGNDEILKVDVLGKDAFALFIEAFVNIVGQVALPSCYGKPCKQRTCNTCVAAIGAALHVTVQLRLAAALATCITGSGPFGAVICEALYPSAAIFSATLIQKSLEDAQTKCSENCCPDLG